MKLFGLFPFIFWMFTGTISAVKDSVLITNVQQIAVFENAVSFGLSGRGKIYVSDNDVNEIICLNREGTVLSSTGSFGSGKDQFNNPSGIAVTAFSVFICDRNNKRLKELNHLLQTKNILSTEKSPGPGFFPELISATPSGVLFIADYVNKSIYKFSSGGYSTEVFLSLNTLPIKITALKGIAATDNNCYIIADSSLTVLDAFGTYIQSIPLPVVPTFIQVNGTRIILGNYKNILSVNAENFTITQFVMPDEFNEMDVVSACMENSTLFMLTTSALYRATPNEDR